MDLERQRQATAAASERLKNGEKPEHVPCPKCAQERYVSVDDGKYPVAVCGCCGFSWMIV